MTTVIRKPVVTYDFGPGDMQHRLFGAAVDALQRRGLTQRVVSLQQHFYRYVKKRGNDPDPRQMWPILTDFVKVCPTDFNTMEQVLGKDLARDSAPRGGVEGTEEVPELVWFTLDYLDHVEPEEGEYYREEVYPLLESGVWSRTALLETSAKYLRRVGATSYDARAHATRSVAFSDRQDTN